MTEHFHLYEAQNMHLSFDRLYVESQRLIAAFEAEHKRNWLKKFIETFVLCMYD